MKLKQKTLLSVLFSLLFISFSNANEKLKKNQKPSEKSYIKAKINGNEVIIDAQEYFNTFYGELPDGRWYLGISGSLPEENESGSQVTMGIQLWQLQPIKTGNFQNGNWEEFGFFGNLYVGVLLEYQNINYGMTGFVTDMNAPKATLNITEITSSHIRASFSGTIYEPISRSSLVITDGELYIKRTD